MHPDTRSVAANMRDFGIAALSLSVSRSATQQARAELVRAEAAAAPSTSQSQAVTDVHSPTARRVLRVMHESGGRVTAGTPLLETGNTHGRSDGTRTVVERGVTEGDHVVIEPSDALVDGSRVQSSELEKR
jgi:hypothetical protein